MKPKFLAKLTDISSKTNNLSKKFSVGMVDGILKKGEELLDKAEQKLDSSTDDTKKNKDEDVTQETKIDKSVDVNDKDFL